MARNIATTSSTDTIVAPATAAGAAALAIVRLSGPQALAMATVLVGDALTEADAGRLTLLSMAGIDQCMAVRWQAPRSATGEDLVEFHLHGSPVVVRAAIDACIAAGARLAEAGEFTRRALLNGKLDLAQAEAVAELASAQTDAARRVALRRLGGELSRLVAEVRAVLIDVLAEIEARIDYPEEVSSADLTERYVERLRAAAARLEVPLRHGRRGEILAGAARVVLAGAPNAGKSSLFNALVGRDRAIVSPLPGTTRDTIEATIDIDGLPVILVDTAGLRDNAEDIEALGIARSRREADAADLVLHIVDGASRGEGTAHRPGVVAVVTKSDLPIHHARAEAISVSAVTGQGLDELRIRIATALSGSSAGHDGELLFNARQHAAAAKALAAVQEAVAALGAGAAPELATADLAMAISELDAITGSNNLDEELLDVIFSKFCLGK